MRVIRIDLRVIKSLRTDIYYSYKEVGRSKKLVGYTRFGTSIILYDRLRVLNFGCVFYGVIGTYITR